MKARAVATALASREQPERVRRRAVSSFLLVFFAQAYFVGALGWNQAARVKRDPHLSPKAARTASHNPYSSDTINLGLWLGLPPLWDLGAFLLFFGGWTIGLFRSTRAADHPA